MRPKFVALLAVSALALVGCSSAAEPAPEPAENATASAAPSASAEPSPSQEPGMAEEAFLAQLSDIKDKEDELSSKLKKKASDSYLLDRGEAYCGMLETEETVNPVPSTSNDTTDYQIESMILQSARTHLCPETAS